jgi:hypothetical protein
LVYFYCCVDGRNTTKQIILTVEIAQFLDFLHRLIFWKEDNISKIESPFVLRRKCSPMIGLALCNGPNYVCSFPQFRLRTETDPFSEMYFFFRIWTKSRNKATSSAVRHHQNPYNHCNRNINNEVSVPIVWMLIRKFKIIFNMHFFCTTRMFLSGPDFFYVELINKEENPNNWVKIYFYLGANLQMAFTACRPLSSIWKREQQQWQHRTRKRDIPQQKTERNTDIG